MSNLTELDLTVARAVHDVVGKRMWCFGDGEPYDVDGLDTTEIANNSFAKHGSISYTQCWCYRTERGAWQRVPAYSLDDHAAFDALRMFCAKHGWSLEYNTSYAESDDEPSEQELNHWVRICSEIAEETELSFALAVSMAVMNADRRWRDGDLDDEQQSKLGKAPRKRKVKS